MKYLLALFITFSAFAQDYYSFGLKAHLYEPATPKKDMPIFVLLHGCKLGEEDFTDLTGIKKHLSEKSFAVLSIEQSVYNNYDHCWNWFYITNQMTGLVNEPFTIKSFVEFFKNTEFYSNSKVFLIGFSSGGAMALNTSYLYPEVFDGVLVHSGLAFKVAKTVEDVNNVLLNPPQVTEDFIKDTYFGMPHPQDLNHIKKWIFVQGKEDARVSFKHKSIIMDQLLGCFDFKDDQRANESVDLLVTAKEFAPESKYSYDLKKTLINGEVEVLDFSIDEMKHAWSGGVDSKYADPNGPDITSIMLDEFFFAKK